jgi:hypothetical protein
MNVIRNLECWLDTIVEDCLKFYVITDKNNNLEITVGEANKFSFDKNEVPKVTAFLRSLSILRVQSRFVKGLADAIEVYLKVPREKDKPTVFIFKKDGPDPDTIAQAAEGELTTRPWGAE